jgi:crotonobetainyl-CoA:carnitine CoA-transferase CaiB-like acyl-CoA transferase
MKEGVRYQIYETKDGRHVLFMASEQAFWKAFCEALDRNDLFDRWPGSKFADHARNNIELQDELREIFLSKTADEWVVFGDQVNTPIAPVNTPSTLQDDPQFQARLGWIAKDVLGAEQLPSPMKVVGAELPVPAKAPSPGQDTDEILRSLLGYDDARIAELRESGAVG